MINAAVEGESDRGAVEALIIAAGHDVGKVIPARGKSRLDPKIPKYSDAARLTNWLVLRDSDGACPVELKSELSPPQNPRFVLRIAHSMVEAWFLADAGGFAEYFHVSAGKIPRAPEELRHAKTSLLSLCARSRSRMIREDLVAKDGKEGPLYVARLNEFARERWDVAAAAERSPSLARAIASLRRLPQG